jgi:ligand-binding sensor protein
MKGVRILVDEQRNKRIVQIDLDLVSKDPELLEDLVDVLIAESRRNDPTVSLDDYLRLTKRKSRK